jgi:hypothetical protein
MVPRVERFESIRKQLNSELKSLYEVSRKLFGDKVVMSKLVIRYSIKGEDPRWIQILGPQWRTLINRHPDKPRYFFINFEFGWSEECKVLQRFQACLENQNLCDDTKVEGSAFQIKNINGRRILVDGKPLKEWEVAFQAGEGFLDLLRWAQSFIRNNARKYDYEELMIAFAEQYKLKTDKLLKKLM